MPIPDTSAWLVVTKLNPPLLRGDTIRRPHLEEALCRAVTTVPVTLLSAPAGYGKSTTLAALPHLLPDRPLAWVTLDAEENDPVRFLSLITAALQRLHPNCGQGVWPLLSGAGSEAAGLKRAVGALVGDIAAWLPAPFTLVLDDLHFVTEPSVYIALEYLLDHQPPQMHLALGTRSDPPLRLARLAARRQLAELRRSDLGFSESEAHQLLNETLGLHLSQSEVAALQERTEGWPAGLCLLAGPLGRMGAPESRAQFLAAVAHSERYALDFLAEEVLGNLPDDLRRFLMQTSVLAELTPSACRAVTGRPDAADVLEELYRHNLAIASITAGPDGEPVYRYHALFTRLLGRQLERELPGEIPQLHARAAGAQRTPGRAVGHYLTAGLWEEAAGLITQCGMDLLHRGMAETIRQWYGALPADVAARHPRLTVLLGRCEIQRGDYDAAEIHLEQARRAFVAEGDTAGEGEAVVSLLTMSVQNDDREGAARLVARALELPLAPAGRLVALLVRAWLQLGTGAPAQILADMQEALAIPPATRNPVAALLGFIYTSAPMLTVPGCLEVAERYCAEAGALAAPGTALRLGADELTAWCLLLRGRTDEALARAEAAEALRQQLGGWVVLGCEAPLLLSIIYLARGATAEAAQAVERLLQRVERAPRSRWALYLQGAHLALTRLGRTAEAAAVMTRLSALRGEQAPTSRLMEHLTGLLAPAHPHPGPALPEQITEREWAVLRLIVAGRTNRQIGEELYITEETVKTHVARLLRKLDVTSRTQAAVRGRELGL